MQSLTWEGLNGSNCKTWWEETKDTNIIKMNLKRAGVDHILTMLVFSIKEFEHVLKGMVAGYDQHTHRSMVQYGGCHLTISYSAPEFARIFGIPN